MIATIMRIGWLTLRRDRVAQVLTFALPIAFFTVFLLVFGTLGRGRTNRVPLAVADEDHTEASRRFVAALQNDPGLRVTCMTRDDPPQPLTQAQAREMITNNRGVTVAVVIRAGFAERFGGFFNPGDGAADAHVDLLADSSDPIAPQMVMGLLQRAAMTALPDLFMERGVGLLERFGGPLTDSQRLAVSQWLGFLRSTASAPASAPGEGGAGGATGGGGLFGGGLVRVHVEDVLAAAPDKSPVSAFYAAGIAVLFLLFSTMASAGVLLDEEANGTLERLLVSRVTMGRFLIGRWLYVTVLGIAQLTTMFLWGWAVFGVKLWTPAHLAGFVVMTLVTAAAAAAFGLVLASACRTRAQLDGVGTTFILLMSAVGGSMFPRFMMPDWMKQIGLLTFNAWALDGFQKVFWYEQSVARLWPQLAVLAALTVALLTLARLLARRWEMT